MEHWRAKVARSEERRGCHRHRYLVAPKAFFLFGTRTVMVWRVQSVKEKVSRPTHKLCGWMGFQMPVGAAYRC